MRKLTQHFLFANKGLTNQAAGNVYLSLSKRLCFNDYSHLMRHSSRISQMTRFFWEAKSKWRLTPRQDDRNPKRRRGYAAIFSVGVD